MTEFLNDAMGVILLVPAWIHVAAAILFAGFGRAMVGDGAWSRGFVFPLTSGYAALIGFGLSWWALSFAVVTAITISAGYTKWENKPFMAARYGLPAVALTGAYVWIVAYPSPPGLTLMLICLSAWAAACALVGASYSTIQDAFEDDMAHAFGDEADSSRVAEFFAGAIIQGAPALMRYALPT